MTIENLKNFEDKSSLFRATFDLFDQQLNLPLNEITNQPLPLDKVLRDQYSQSKHKKINTCYLIGFVEDSVFDKNSKSTVASIQEIQEKPTHDGLAIFAIDLTVEKLPTRTELADITRSFNRSFNSKPVVVLFRYSVNNETYIALANCERSEYKQDWRDGEKAGKISLLRDICTKAPHSGHLRILKELDIKGKQVEVPTEGKKTKKQSVNNFTSLYLYWSSVFNTSLLNKEFYKELSNWYFWAMHEVFYPGSEVDADRDGLFRDDSKFLEHNAKNLIRLLTRLLFTWFIKEKNLIPINIFDEEYISEHLNSDGDESSVYYKAVLQNLFFATLNCPIKPDSVDSRERGFRGDESYGKHRGVDYLMRYKKYFKNPDAFLKMVNKVVPFLNGGLFECLDDKENKIYIDGFSDNMSKSDGKNNVLIVPDYLFFGKDESVDLSADYGVNNKGTKEASVKGLINILKSYKFTIEENTPIEEDVALDPELLGKVFENLLASFNPETKTTARKQTGSFYTPREIVNYMVDESLIAHLKNSFDWKLEEKELDKKLHILVSFDEVNPFENDNQKAKKIIHSLDSCKILDPACGSGAFPMGILQKMVHILNKVDPKNEYWQKLQLEKAEKDTKGVFAIKDKAEREQLLLEINEAFDETINNPDYARKLFLIENCIYGVDIQPIATQISKLRFFISLVVEQKVNDNKENFGIRPLPNLETKFVTANTLIGIDKPDDNLSLFDTQKVKDLEQELKTIRHKLFGAKTKATKVKYRKRDEELRNEIAEELEKNGWGNKTAQQLASWDPYDQNGVSPFFDPEWMFDIKDGFDVVIGNPPYVQIQKFSGQQCQKDWQAQNYKTFAKTGDIYSLFYEKGNMIIRDSGILTFITSNKWMRANYGKATRKYFAKNTKPIILIDFGGYKVFESATVDTNILIFNKSIQKQNVFDTLACTVGKDFTASTDIAEYIKSNGVTLDSLSENSWIISNKAEFAIKKQIEKIGTPLKDWDISINYGIKTGFNEAFIISSAKKDELIAKDPKSAEIIKPILRGRDIKRYKAEFADLWLISTFPALHIDIEKYPAVKNHLLTFTKKRLEQSGEKGSRKKTNNKWFEVQDTIAYYEEFEKEKIVYPNMTKYRPFVYDIKNYLTNQKCFILTSKTIKLKNLIAILNSWVFEFAFKDYFPELLGGTRELSKVFFEKLPIPKISQEQQLPFEILFDCILFAKENNLNNEADIFESVVDGMVFELYFPQEVQEASKGLLIHLQDLSQIKEEMSDEVKNEVIETTYQMLSDENGVIYQNLNSLDEIKEWRIISGLEG